MEEKENGSGTLTRLSAFLKGGKGTKIIVAVGLVGMGLILASNFWTPKSDKQVAAAKASAEEFVAKTETKLAALVVKGVVVVCQGGDNAAVSQRIVDAITTALNISSKRVCVTKSN